MIEKILRKFSDFKGKQRIARILLKNKIQNNTDLIVAGKYNCQYKVPNIKETIGFELYINGIYEPEIINFITSRIPKEGILIDIGANIGAICIPMCRNRPDIKTIAIEASPRVYCYLEFNKTANNLSNCNIINKAVTDSKIKTIDFFSPFESFGKGSLENVITSNSEKVETISLDSLFMQNDVGPESFIKVDIEGHEYAAFKSGENVLNKSEAPNILFEFVDWAENSTQNYKAGDAQKLLMDYHYTLYELKTGGRLERMSHPLEEGSAMIYATKKPL